jgi:endonuclease-3
MASRKKDEKIINQKLAMKQLKFLESKTKKIRLAADRWLNDWQTLVAIILSARTRDEVTILVCEKMFKKYPTPEKFSELTLSQIKKEISSINFYNNKSKYIFNMTGNILKKFDGKIPHDIDKLITLPGVGRKTANVFLAQKGGANIGVDTHVNYISNYLGWINSKNPAKIEKKLEKLFPKSKWKRVNNTLVIFGKTYTSKKDKDAILDKARELDF